MAKNTMMRAVQYNTYGGGAAALKTERSIHSFAVKQLHDIKVYITLHVTVVAERSIHSFAVKRLNDMKVHVTPACGSACGRVVQNSKRDMKLRGFMAERSIHSFAVKRLNDMKHVELQVPSPKQDEVLLKMEATSINPFDLRIQKGIVWPFLPRKFPHIPGIDAAGEVFEVGSGVKNFKAGDKVVAVLFIRVSDTNTSFRVACFKPPEVTAFQGAALPIAGLAAHECLLRTPGFSYEKTGQQLNLLITAASGGVGQYAVQLAKLGNAHVTATCGARNLDLVKSLGADEVIDYKTPDGAALKSPSGRKYDAVIHCATGFPWSTFKPNLSTNGKVFDITPTPSVFMTNALQKLTFSKKQLVPLLMTPKKEKLDFLLNFVKEGKIKAVVDSIHPLSKAEEAWAKSIDGHATGKIIVEP
ncbi:hypothetical protein GOBAR_AA18213 [Gossypium barbadense]|uniref:Enoyl reductase (ER) domain-containing protein n=1 Tax=Gossypium barbadense TaxID=3634 RepID=A0A2P5XGG8_GOSBA|nr:hypothetical protein GOBAR_AA18213 [Gossypium barbadense]